MTILILAAVLNVLPLHAEGIDDSSPNVTNKPYTFVDYDGNSRYVDKYGREQVPSGYEVSSDQSRGIGGLWTSICDFFLGKED